MDPFLRNCWYVAAWEHELEQTPIGRQIIGEPVALFRSEDGAVRAVANRCPHRHAPLALGRVEGSNLRCMYHGLLFGPDGHCIKVPGSDVIPPNSSVRTYPVVVRDSWIWIWMGDPEKADAGLIPAAFGLDDARLWMRASAMDYKANYMLINDNLCDLSHLDFVHEQTLGQATGGGWSEDLPRVTAQDRGLRVERWFVAKPASPNNPQLVDTWSTYDYLAPGIFIMENKSYPHGMAEQLGYHAPLAEPMTYRVDQQAVTPISETETRYFYATGFDRRIPERVLDGIFATASEAFAEDRTMIEGQQAIWDRTPAGTPMAFIANDKGPSMFRRIMKRLLDKQAN